jgi:hypothetical protein
MRIYLAGGEESWRVSLFRAQRPALPALPRLGVLRIGFIRQVLSRHLLSQVGIPALARRILISHVCP